MDDSKITIIEGPPPTFETVFDTWANGIAESPTLGSVAVTQLRTANGPALVERCYRAWHQREPIHLEFRTTDGITQEVPIVAARATDTPDGQLLLLWVRLPEDDLVVDFIIGDDDDDLDDDYFNDDDDDYFVD